ncbi:MAG: hypothetical protein QM703_10785 [Gemmatales bacterium]
MSIVLSSMDVIGQEKTQPTGTRVPAQSPSAEVQQDHCRRFTIISPDLYSEVELAMEPDQHPAAKPFKMAVIHEGIPFATFGAAEAQAEYLRLQEAGVSLSQFGSYEGPVAITVVYDTSGNMLQIAQKH